MDNQELHKEMVTRFDRLEKKLDSYSEETVRNAQDISWVKGYIKIGTGAIISAVIALFSTLAHIIYK